MNKGFTLLELLITIALSGIIATLALTTYFKSWQSNINIQTTLDELSDEHIHYLRIKKSINDHRIISCANHSLILSPYSQDSLISLSKNGNLQFQCQEIHNPGLHLSNNPKLPVLIVWTSQEGITHSVMKYE